MTATVDDEHLVRLLREVERRIIAYPARQWSPRLLAALIAVLDLEIPKSVNEVPRADGSRDLFTVDSEKGPDTVAGHAHLRLVR